MNTPTPRTDAAVKLTFAAGHNTVCPNFARELERELADQTKRFHDEIVRRQGTERNNYELNLKERDHLLGLLAIEREKVRLLRSALENLADEQNGAPLERHRDEWQAAMDEARDALAATEGAK